MSISSKCSQCSRIFALFCFSQQRSLTARHPVLTNRRFDPIWRCSIDGEVVNNTLVPPLEWYNLWSHQYWLCYHFYLFCCGLCSAVVVRDLTINQQIFIHDEIFRFYCSTLDVCRACIFKRAKIFATESDQLLGSLVPLWIPVLYDALHHGLAIPIISRTLASALRIVRIIIDQHCSLCFQYARPALTFSSNTRCVSPTSYLNC